MAHTLETVMKQLGDEAQLVGGRVIVWRDGKHIDVGGLGMADSVFSLTEAGVALLDVPVAVKHAKSETKKGLKPAEVNASKGDDELNLDELA